MFIGIVACMTACGDSSGDGEATSTKRQAMTIHVEPICKDEDIWLRTTIKNASSRSIQIENGVLPWEYDPVGTSFAAESSGKKLSRNTFITPIGRAGSIVMQPGQERSGETPIEFMFPEIAQIVGKQPITVHWAYWTRPQADKSEVMSGAVALLSDPCAGAPAISQP